MIKKQKYKGPSGVDNRERRSNAQGLHPTQDTSRMSTARLK